MLDEPASAQRKPTASAADSIKLAVYCAPGVDASAALALLGQLGLKGLRLAARPFEDLAGARADADGPRLVVLPGCAGAVKAALDAGTPPSAGLAAWHEAAATALDAFRRNRRKVSLVEAEAMAADPAAAAAALARRLGLAQGDAALPRPRLAKAPDAWQSLVLAATLDRAPASRKLLVELTASALLSGGPLDDRPDPDAAAKAVRAEGGLSGDALIARSEAELLSEQLALVQDRLQASVTHFAALADRRQAEHAAQLAALQAEVDRRIARIAELDNALQRERDRLAKLEAAHRQDRDRVAELETALSRSETERRDLEARVQGQTAAADGLRQTLASTTQIYERSLANARSKAAEAEAACAALQADLAAQHAAFVGSTSWRLTAPVRAIKIGLLRLRGGAR